MAYPEAAWLPNAASLSPVSPFHGVYILTSVFKSSQLPPIASAHGRRYYLHGSLKDAVAPVWETTAAAEMLKRNGATVFVAIAPGGHTLSP